MAAMKKGTKLKDNPKEFMLRVRLDKETLSKIDIVAGYSGLSRSEIVRRGIELQFGAMR